MTTNTSLNTSKMGTQDGFLQRVPALETQHAPDESAPDISAETKYIGILLNCYKTATNAAGEFSELQSHHFQNEITSHIFLANRPAIRRKKSVCEVLEGWIAEGATSDLSQRALDKLPLLKAAGAKTKNKFETAQELGKQIVAAAKERAAKFEASDLHDASAAKTTKPRPLLQLISIAEVLARPRLEYLLQDILLERGTSVVTANYGAFKSFNVLDMALCIATGKSWHGRKVKQGTVVYIIGEGAYTSADRLQAWFIRHQAEIPTNFFFIETAIQIADATERERLISGLREISPNFVILDTLAKCNIGKDENSTEAMGLVTHGMEEIGRELGAHVMAVHHNNKAGNVRGSNSLPANIDTHILLEKAPGRVVTFKCDKQKGAPFEPFSLIGRVVELPELDEYGRPVTSLIFDTTEAASSIPKADETRQRVLDVLRNEPDGLSASKWLEKVSSVCGRSRFYDFVKELEEGEIIRKVGSIWKVAEGLNQERPISPIQSDSSESERVIQSD